MSKELKFFALMLVLFSGLFIANHFIGDKGAAGHFTKSINSYDKNKKKNRANL